MSTMQQRLHERPNGRIKHAAGHIYSQMRFQNNRAKIQRNCSRHELAGGRKNVKLKV